MTNTILNYNIAVQVQSLLNNGGNFVSNQYHG